MDLADALLEIAHKQEALNSSCFRQHLLANELELGEQPFVTSQRAE